MAVRVGIGGWTFPPWRGPFYPAGLPQKRELEFASRAVTSIEINGTFYGTQKRDSFVRWYNETPEDFVFSLKGPRFTTNRRVLAEAGESVNRFLGSGVLELKEKLGPINWQMATTKAFDAADFEAFLALLPAKRDGRTLRHVVEVRHPSFVCPEFVKLLRRYGVAAVVADHAVHPLLSDVTAPFVYVRLQAASEQEATGYSAKALAGWHKRAKDWAMGKVPKDLPVIGERAPAARSRDVFIYMINGFKPKAPAAAMALIERLG